MKRLHHQAFSLFLLLPAALAFDCNALSSVAWPAAPLSGHGGGGGNGGSSGGDTCSRLCGNNSGCLGLCDPARAVRLKQRADPLACSSNETCFKYVDGSFLCLDVVSGLFHDDEGSTGNVKSGVVTAADGRVTTIDVGPVPTSMAPNSVGSASLAISSSTIRQTSAVTSTGLSNLPTSMKATPSTTTLSSSPVSAAGAASTTASRSSGKKYEARHIFLGTAGLISVQVLF